MARHLRPTRRGRLAPVVLGVVLLAAAALGTAMGSRAAPAPAGTPTPAGTATTPAATATTPAVTGDPEVTGPEEPGPAPASPEPVAEGTPSTGTGVGQPDTRPPALRVARPAAVVGGGPAEIHGVAEHVEHLTVAGRTVEIADDGSFTVALPRLPDQPVGLEATGVDGSTVTTEVTLASVPSRVEADDLRAVHVSFYGWADARLRGPILEMAERGQINAVQLDLKDESGQVGYRTGIQRAHELGAAGEIFDLAAAVAELHGRGLHVIGRIVAFRDPVLVSSAWERGEHDLVVQRPDGQPYTGYDGFANFAHPEVRDYNIAVATEAAAAGVDAILWDYIRRPDGPLAALVFPGLEGTPEQAIAAFLAAADEALAPYGVQHGASVYGIAATRPTQIAQDVPAIADHLDYVAPMLYPSHWRAGEYGVADPESQPYDITLASLRDFVDLLEGKRARLVPWLQDFTLRVPYGAAEVRAQLSAAADAGIDEWIMWDPFVRYTTDAYDPGSAPPTVLRLPPPAPAAAPLSPH